VRTVGTGARGHRGTGAQGHRGTAVGARSQECQRGRASRPTSSWVVEPPQQPDTYADDTLGDAAESMVGRLVWPAGWSAGVPGAELDASGRVRPAPGAARRAERGRAAAAAQPARPFGQHRDGAPCLPIPPGTGAMAVRQRARTHGRTGARTHPRTRQSLGPGTRNANEAGHLARPRRGWWNHRSSSPSAAIIRSARRPSQAATGWCARGGI